MTVLYNLSASKELVRHLEPEGVTSFRTLHSQ